MFRIRRSAALVWATSNAGYKLRDMNYARRGNININRSYGRVTASYSVPIDYSEPPPPLSSQTQFSRLAGCSLQDSPDTPRCPQAYPLPASRRDPRSPTVLHPRWCPPSTPPRASSLDLRADETPLYYVREDTLWRPFPQQSSRPSQWPCARSRRERPWPDAPWTPR